MATFAAAGSQLTVSGNLDVGAEKELRNQLQTFFINGTGNVKVDLSGVEMIASVCIGRLVVFWTDLRSAGRRGELIVSPVVKKVLVMTGLTSVLMAEGPAEYPGPGGEQGAGGGRS